VKYGIPVLDYWEKTQRRYPIVDKIEKERPAILIIA